MIKEEVFKYAKFALADKDLETVLSDEFRDGLLRFFTNKNYGDGEIDVIQSFMTELVQNLRQRGYKKLSMSELDEFLDYSKYRDQSGNYTPGIYQGELEYKDSFASEAMFEDDEFKVIHLGSLYYDNNQESVEKYRIVRFAKGDVPASIFECYSNIDSIMLADNQEYREAVKKHFDKNNILKLHSKGYAGTIRKNDQTNEYEFVIDKIALSAVMDYEKSIREKEGEQK